MSEGKHEESVSVRTYPAPRSQLRLTTRWSGRSQGAV
jgi:hypothetical protein